MGNIEYEGKIVDIEAQEVARRIIDLGGKQTGEFMFKRYVFDTIPVRPERWLRLRTDGHKTTLALKHITSDDVDGTAEWEVVVSDFDTMLTILKKSGLRPKGYQENRRIEFTLDGVVLTIDYWPRLKPYLEIEAQDKLTVEAVAERLGFDKSQLTGVNTRGLYAQKGIKLLDNPELRF